MKTIFIAITVITVITVITLASISTHASASTVLGNWCWTMIPNDETTNIDFSIIVNEQNKTYLLIGKEDTEGALLRSIGRGIYEKVGDILEEKFRIVPNTGSLELIDNYGLIGTAPYGKCD
ncbi:MAG: hypothetical protein KAR62_01775 [Sphingomonadales bacterium]|nr:hypothetical protein [Sphingomonadales bacterium]